MRASDKDIMEDILYVCRGFRSVRVIKTYCNEQGLLAVVLEVEELKVGKGRSREKT
jgi:hypothetical protein